MDSATHWAHNWGWSSAHSSEFSSRGAFAGLPRWPYVRFVFFITYEFSSRRRLIFFLYSGYLSFLSRLITHRLHYFLSTDALHHVDFIRYSAKWSCLPGRELMTTITEQPQPILFPIPSSPFLSHNQRAALATGELWDDSIWTSALWTSILARTPFYPHHSLSESRSPLLV